MVGGRPYKVSTAIAGTVVLAMVLGFSLQKVVDSALASFGLPQRTLLQNPHFLSQLPGRVATVIELADLASPAEREALLEEADRPTLHIVQIPAPVKGMLDRNEPDANLLKQNIQAALLRPRIVVVIDRRVRFDMREDSRSEEGGAPSRSIEHGFFIEAALSDGHWLLFTSGINPPPVTDPVATYFSHASFAAWLAVSIVVAILLSLLAAKLLVAPLSRLSLAAEQLGGSGDTLAIPLQGPWEVRTTTDAFNRMQERLRRFNADRTRMIAAMSHDLRTPLTRLRLRVEMLDDIEAKTKMLNELDTMNSTMASALSFARDDAQQEPKELVDLSALTEGICMDAADAGEPVTFSGPAGITIQCRPAAIRRAITNLIDNAVKYGKKATVSLVEGPEQVVITVEDEGPGIERSEQQKVFDPFYRLEWSRNADTGGVGLGLSVARSIVWEHGGEISLNNRQGGGLTARIQLPAT